MSLDRVLTILGILGGLSTVALWISKARESDVVLSLTLQYLTRDLDALRGELREVRGLQIESARRAGIRIGNTRMVLYRLINHYNDPNKRNLNFEYVNFEELEE